MKSCVWRRVQRREGNSPAQRIDERGGRDAGHPGITRGRTNRARLPGRKDNDEERKRGDPDEDKSPYSVGGRLTFQERCACLATERLSSKQKGLVSFSGALASTGMEDGALPTQTTQ